MTLTRSVETHPTGVTTINILSINVVLGKLFYYTFTNNVLLSHVTPPITQPFTEDRRPTGRRQEGGGTRVGPEQSRPNMKVLRQRKGLRGLPCDHNSRVVLTEPSLTKD